MANPVPLRSRGAQAALLGAAALLAACAANPATGGRDFTAFMSPADELRIGREQHPRILERFGGVYENPGVAAYVDRIGQDLVRVSELPNLGFTFTVLDDDIVNAFALPGGYVYISRGLLGIANTEAELAAVLGHEIGHVTARHAAQRHSRRVLAAAGSNILGVLGSVYLGTSAIGDIVSQGSAVYLQSFSREHEFEADTLGVRYLARAGYETGSMASFLSSLQAYNSLEAKVSGLSDPAARFNIMSTHPRTRDRAIAATRSANVAAVANPKIGNLDYLRAIDGIAFGDSPREGYVRGRTFVHEPLDFLFEVPPDFNLFNGARQVAAHGPNDALIVFSGGGGHGGSMTGYISRVWAGNIPVEGLEAIIVNGMDAATAAARIRTRRGVFDARMVAIRHDDGRIYRFVFLTRPGQTAALDLELRRTTFSFRRLDAADRARYRPWRIGTRAVGPGDTVASLSRDFPMPGPKDEWFRVLNGLRPGSEPFPGQVVKVVVE